MKFKHESYTSIAIANTRRQHVPFYSQIDPNFRLNTSVAPLTIPWPFSDNKKVSFMVFIGKWIASIQWFERVLWIAYVARILFFFVPFAHYFDTNCMFRMHERLHTHTQFRFVLYNGTHIRFIRRESWHSLFLGNSQSSVKMHCFSFVYHTIIIFLCNISDIGIFAIQRFHRWFSVTIGHVLLNWITV